MRKIRVSFNLLFSFALLFGLFSPSHVLAEETNEANIKVQLLSVNDLHGRIDNEAEYEDQDGDGEEELTGPMNYLAAYLKQYEAQNENTLIVHSGDMIGGSPLVSALFQDEPTVEIMEEIGFDVGTVGNHEFDEGIDEMLRMVNGGEHPEGTPGYDGMDFPVVAANVQYKDSKELMLDPYFVQEIAGQKIGFIGVATTETPNMIVQTGNENLEITDETEAINQYVPELKEQGVKSIIVLAHNPGYQEGDVITGDAADIANGVDDEVDVIIAAHNHVKLNGYVDDKLIVQAYEYGEAFGAIDLEIDPATGDIVKKSAEIVIADKEEIEADENVSAILDTYEAKVAELKSEVVGEAAIDLEGGYGIRGEVGDNALGNLIADGMKEAMNADFAFMNGGGIRDDISAGDITFGDLFDVQPFGNTLIKAEFTGTQIEEILNLQISEQYGPDYSVSGLKYTWQGETQEVVNILLPDGSKMKKNETYTLVVNNYMYYDNDQMINEYGQNQEQGPNDLDATVDFVKSFDEPIKYEAEGRISQVEAPSEGNNGKDDQANKSEEKKEEAKENKEEKGKAATYVVKSGDTLWAIALSAYGNGAEWNKIFDANKDVISNPNQIFIGQKIILP
ncbi:5'-nucleotidase C-terminal domain-containing protein [Aquibacillus albus]|uniref:2',3'-cyclic-nucleotide 2'-phosphodiesterase (5'-nucleotidase family) n=1 Tax=Aquibacillus albus TaxID=1168171 RepID=A0ABS2N0I0_9BACI|nr:2',3'-cyclic-nucleotide 2'-phosphodiesterase (5'-nucleotidase family) [Aquibacillus albus]